MPSLTENVTAVCNEALAHLGMGSIADIEVDFAAGHPSAIACTRFFNTSRTDVLREHKWAFATVQETLVEDTDEAHAIVGWDFVYTYPVAATAVWNVYNEGSVDTKDTNEFEVVYSPALGAKLICTDVEDAVCDETYAIDDPADWDSKFKEAFGYKLAAKMAHTLIGDPSIGNKLMEIYAGLISDAKRIGSKEKTKKPNQGSGYANAR